MPPARGRFAGAVGEVLAWNTIGAILGALAAGFVLIRLVGIERSLEMLAALNLALAVGVASATGDRAIARWAGCAVAAVAARRGAVASGPGAAVEPGTDGDLPQQPARRVRLPRRGAGRPGQHRHPVLPRRVANSTISVIRPKAADQAILVNGKVVASTDGGGRPVPVHARPSADVPASGSAAGLRARDGNGNDARRGVAASGSRADRPGRDRSGRRDGRPDLRPVEPQRPG